MGYTRILLYKKFIFLFTFIPPPLLGFNQAVPVPNLEKGGGKDLTWLGGKSLSQELGDAEHQNL